MTAPFAHLLAAYHPRILRVALGYLGDEQVAREIAQDALLRALRARDRFDPARPIYPWLRRIVKNACLDELARGRHRAAPGLEAERMAANQPTALDTLEARDAERRVHAALEGLPEAQREILVLRHFEDLAYAEIAEILDIPEGTVMSRLFRARKALAAVMREEP